jgi:hypothetical protein
VRIGFGIPQIIEGNDLHVVLFSALIMGAQDIAPDATVAVDGDFDAHRGPPDAEKAGFTMTGFELP